MKTTYSCPYCGSDKPHRHIDNPAIALSLLEKTVAARDWSRLPERIADLRASLHIGKDDSYLERQ